MKNSFLMKIPVIFIVLILFDHSAISQTLFNEPKNKVKSSSDILQLTVTTTTGNDNTTLIIDDTQSPAYVIGQDMEKWIGTGTGKPQLYSILGGINFAFNSLPYASVVNLPLGLYSNASVAATFHLDKSQSTGVSQLILTDKTLNKTADLMLGDYNFTTSTGTVTTRFTLTAQKVVTENKRYQTVPEPVITVSNRMLIISNLPENTLIRAFDLIGHTIYSSKTSQNSIEVPLKMEGIYYLQILSAGSKWTHKVIIK